MNLKNLKNKRIRSIFLVFVNSWDRPQIKVKRKPDTCFVICIGRANLKTLKLQKEITISSLFYARSQTGPE